MIKLFSRACSTWQREALMGKKTIPATSCWRLRMMKKTAFESSCCSTTFFNFKLELKRRPLIPIRNTHTAPLCSTGFFTYEQEDSSSLAALHSEKMRLPKVQ